MSSEDRHFLVRHGGTMAGDSVEDKGEHKDRLAP